MSRKSLVLRLTPEVVSELKEYSESAQILVLAKAIELVKAPAPDLQKEDEDYDPRSIISKEVDDILETLEEVEEDESEEEEEEGEEIPEDDKEEQRTVAHQDMADLIEEVISLLVSPESGNVDAVAAVVLEEMSTPISWSSDDKSGLTTLIYG